MLPGQVTLADIVNEGLKFKPKPSWIKIPPKHLWCPYCNRTKEFIKDKHLGVKRCECCGISIKDFYVRRFNHLFY